MLKKITILSFALLLASFAMAAPSPLGYWTTIDDETGEPKSIVKIYLEDDELKATLVELINSDTPIEEQICKSCKGLKKNQPYIGFTIMWGLHKDGDRWSGGMIQDPSNGKIYKSFLQVSEDGQSVLVRGYIGLALIGRSQTWIKVIEE